MSRRNTTRVTTRLVDVTPAMAEEWLGHNNRNRHIRNAMVNAYARDMTAGRWELNGEAIKFDTDGTLLDGQHRLWAVIESGETIPMIVVDGLPAESQATMDSGVKRTAADVLGLDGETNVNILAAIARRVVIYDQVNREHATASGRAATKAEIRAAVDTYPDLRDAAGYAVTNSARVDLSASILGFCYWVLNRIDEQHAERFFDGLISGADLARNNPILVLRNKLRDAASSTAKAPPHVLIAYVFRAWNYTRAEKPMTVLRLKSTDTFPVPK